MNLHEIISKILDSKYSAELFIGSIVWGLIVSELPMDLGPSMVLSAVGGLVIGYIWAKLNSFL